MTSFFFSFFFFGGGGTKQWRGKVPKSGVTQRHVIYVPLVKNQYKRVVFGYMVIY